MANRARKTAQITPQRRGLLAQVHIAAKDMGLDENTYRELLHRITGSRSAAGIDDAGLRQVLQEMRRLGWRPAARQRTGRAGRKWRSASPYPHVRKVWALWGELKRRRIWRDPRRSSLAAFVRRMTGADDPDWLTASQARLVIEALKDIGERSGIDWLQVEAQARHRRR